MILTSVTKDEVGKEKQCFSASAILDTTDRQPFNKVALEEWMHRIAIRKGLQRQPWPYDLFLLEERLPVGQIAQLLCNVVHILLDLHEANIAMDTSCHSWCKEGRWTSRSETKRAVKTWWLRYLEVIMANGSGRRSESFTGTINEQIRGQLLEWSSWRTSRWCWMVRKEHWNDQGPNSITKLKQASDHDIAWYQTSVELSILRGEDRESRCQGSPWDGVGISGCNEDVGHCPTTVTKSG